MKVDVRDAVNVAQGYLQQLQDTIAVQLQDLRLEEVEISDDKKHWFVTLGFNRPADKSENPLADIVVSPKYEREYKIFKIDAETGEVRSMKIREV